MINAFSKSRRMAWLGGAVLGLVAAAVAWLGLAEAGQGMGTRLLLAALAAFVGVNIAVYFARMLATREYQSRLLLLYEQLDPRAFLEAVEPLQKARLNPSTRSTLLVHIANGWLWAGQPDRALEILDGIQPPEKALETRGLVLGNQATCWLAQGNTDRAQYCMDQLRALTADKACSKEFSLKARHTLAYLELCMNLQRGKQVDVRVLEKDFEASRSPLHKLDVQYRLALAARKKGDETLYASAREYVLQQGAKTVLPERLRP